MIVSLDKVLTCFRDTHRIFHTLNLVMIYCLVGSHRIIVNIQLQQIGKNTRTDT